ncbi:MAG TPA: hypothetical protein VIE91_05465 [Methylophilaceae bacterium]
MRNIVYGMLLSCLLASPVYAADDGGDLKALTAEGDQVVLHANGRWEFIDAKKAAQAAEVAKQYPENQGCPAGSQGGMFGLGRCIPIGDKDFNRGSGSGKGR